MNSSHQTWPLARVLEVHPGADELVILCGDGRRYERSVVKLVPLLKDSDGTSPAGGGGGEGVQAC